MFAAVVTVPFIDVVLACTADVMPVSCVESVLVEDVIAPVTVPVEVLIAPVTVPVAEVMFVPMLVTAPVTEPVIVVVDADTAVVIDVLALVIEVEIP